MKIVELTGTCSAGGALTITGTDKVTGRIEKVIYDYLNGDTGADLVLTAVGTVSEAVLTKANLGTADAVFYPRTLCNKVADGAAFTDVFDKIFVENCSFTAVIAQGGVSLNFRFLVVVSDE